MSSAKKTTETYRDEIPVSGVDISHEIDEDRLAVLADAQELPPILVVEDEGNGALVLDGHHRIELAERRGERTIAAYVVPRAAFEDLLATEFDGEMPSRLEDLDPFILVEGRPYVR